MLLSAFHLQKVSPHLELALTKLFKRDYLRHWNSHSKMPADTEGIRGKHKTGVNISLCTVYSFLHIHVFMSGLYVEIKICSIHVHSHC